MTRQNSRRFSDYCDSWLNANRPRLKASSYAKYGTSMKNHIRPFWGEYYLCDITPEGVTAFTQLLLEEKQLAAKTVRDILALFHSVFSYAGKREAQALQELDLIYPRDARKHVRVLDETEETILGQLLAKEMDRCKFGIYLALRTGMRIGEICALQWGDISPEERTIFVGRTVQRIHCPDLSCNRQTMLVIGTPKSDSSMRLIPLMPDIASLGERFMTGNPDTYVLTGTKQCMDPRKLQRRLQKYLDECGITGVHFHTLRHTFATRCVEAGFDIKTLSEILGHSNISITLDKYVHPDLNLKRENMNRLKPLLLYPQS